MSKFLQKNSFYFAEEKSILLENLMKGIKEEDRKFLKKISQIEGQGLHSKINRKLKTEYGKIEIEINRYWKKILVGDENGEVIGKKRKIFYCDFFEKLVQKGRTITNSLIKKILNLWYEVKYGTAISRIFNKTISTTSVNLVLKNADTNYSLQDFKELAKDKKQIFLAVDDCFHRVVENRKTYKVKNRMLVLYLGKKNGKVYGKTNILEISKTGNKGQNIYQLSEKIKATILEIYGKNLEIVVYGDGANWIKRLATILGGTYILDKFHLLKKLSDLVSLKNNNSLNRFLFKDKFPQLYQKLLKLFQENKTDKVVEVLRQIIKYLEILLEKNLWLFNKINQKTEEIGEFLRYVISNSTAINQLFTFKNASSFTEAFVSSLVKFNIKIKYSNFCFKRYLNNLRLNHKLKNANLILI